MDVHGSCLPPTLGIACCMQDECREASSRRLSAILMHAVAVTMCRVTADRLGLIWMKEEVHDKVG